MNNIAAYIRKCGQEVAEALDVSHQSATRYVETLEREGVLREITGRARNRVYQADAVLEAIAGPQFEFSPGQSEQAVPSSP